jgi:hypothetical protein
MKKKIFFSVLILIFTISIAHSQQGVVESGLNGITQDILKAQMGFLASDWTEGRMAGEKGESLSADYIASMLLLYGVKPAGDMTQNIITGNIFKPERSFFQNFTLIKTQPGDEQVLNVKSLDGKMTKSIDFTFNVDFTVSPSDAAIEIEAPVVFVGYGFKDDKLKYNDFDKIDVKGKFILRIAGIPDFIRKSLTTAEIQTLTAETETTLRSMGAVGIIAFDPMTSLVGNVARQDFMNMSPSEVAPRARLSSSTYSIPGKKGSDNLIRITVSAKAANEILKGTGIDIEGYIKKADLNQPVVLPNISDKSVYFKTTVQTSRVAVKNILGIIEGNNADQVIVIGAHYDHLGTNNGYTWNGADDNASGTVGVMTLAKAIMDTGKKPEKTILIALWTAEEEGLLGSKYWVQNPTIPIKNVKMNMNFDMISRYFSVTDTKKVTMGYSISSPVFKDITMSNIKKYGIDLIVDYQPSENPVGGTDHRSFVAVGIPVMRIKPGHREEYHTPKDEFSTLDWDIMEKIVKICFADAWELANTNW